MNSLVVFAIFFILFILAIIGYIFYKELHRIKTDNANKKLFLTNSAKIKKKQKLDEVLELLGRPHSYSEIDDKYVLTWKQTEETGFNSITRSITVVVNANEIVVDVYRQNLD